MIDVQQRYFTTAKKFLRPQELAQLRAANENTQDLVEGCENLQYATRVVRSVLEQTESGQENFQLCRDETTYARKTLLNPSGQPAYFVFGMESRQAGRLARDQVVIKSDFSQAFLYRDK